jgi:hypothetical protein
MPDTEPRQITLPACVTIAPDELIANTLEDFLDDLSEKATGTMYLCDISWRAIAVTDDGEIIFEVDGDPTMLLDHAEDDGEPVEIVAGDAAAKADQAPDVAHCVDAQVIAMLRRRYGGGAIEDALEAAAEAFDANAREYEKTGAFDPDSQHVRAEAARARLAALRAGGADRGADVVPF